MREFGWGEYRKVEMFCGFGDLVFLLLYTIVSRYLVEIFQRNEACS